MDQARAGLPALQLAGPQESARRVAIGLRGVKPEENRSPNYRLTATGKPPKRCSHQEGKSIRRFWSRCAPKAPQVDFQNCSTRQTPNGILSHPFHLARRGNPAIACHPATPESLGID